MARFAARKAAQSRPEKGGQAKKGKADKDTKSEKAKAGKGEGIVAR